MIRLLCIVASMNTGGAETFLMKLFRTIDASRVKMDFCVSEQARGFYDDEIEAKGSKIHRITPKTKGFLKFASTKGQLAISCPLLCKTQSELVVILYVVDNEADEKCRKNNR